MHQFRRCWTGDVAPCLITSLSRSTTQSTQSRHPSTCVSLTILPWEALPKQSCHLSSHFAIVSFFSHLQSWITYIFLAPGARHVLSAFLFLSSSGAEGWEIRQRFILRFISACRVTVNPFALIPLRKYFQPTYWNKSDHTVKPLSCDLRDISGSSFTLESLIHQKILIKKLENWNVYWLFRQNPHKNIGFKLVSPYLRHVLHIAKKSMSY